MQAEKQFLEKQLEGCVRPRLQRAAQGWEVACAGEAVWYRILFTADASALLKPCPQGAWLFLKIKTTEGGTLFYFDFVSL